MLKKHGVVIISLITAIAIIASAPLLKGGKYENAWLYIFVVGTILSAFFEVYTKWKDRNKR